MRAPFHANQGKNTNQRWYTHMSQLTQFIPPPETYKSEVGSHSTMYQVYSWCIRLITRAWENRLYRLPPKKTTTYILHVVSITTHTHGRRKSNGKEKQRTNEKRKERKEKRRKRKTKRKKEKNVKKKKDKKSKKRQDKKT